MFSRFLAQFNPFASKINSQTIRCQEEIIHAILQPLAKAVVVVTKRAFECYNVETAERRWRIDTTNPLMEMEEEEPLRTPLQAFDVSHVCAAYNHDLNYVITGDDDNCIRVYQISSNASGVKLQFILGKSDQAKSWNMMDDASNVNDPNGTIDSYIVAEKPPHISKKIIDALEMDSKLTGYVTHLLCVGPDKLLSGGLDGVTRLWSLTSRAQLASYSPTAARSTSTSVGTAASAVKTLAFDEVRGRIIVGHLNGYIRQYDYVTGKRVIELGLPNDNPAVLTMSVMTRPDMLVFANENRVVRVWDLSNEQQSTAYIDYANCMLYDGFQDVLFSGSDDGSVFVWKCVLSTSSTAQGLDEIEKNFQQIRKQQIHKAQINSLFYHPDKDVLVTTSQDKTVVLWFDCMKNVIDELDDEMRASLSKDIELEIKDLQQDRVISLLREIADYRSVGSPKLEQMYLDRKLCEIIVRALPVYAYQNIKDEIYQKLNAIEMRAEQETAQNKKLVENSRSNLFKKYQKYIQTATKADAIPNEKERLPCEQELDNIEANYRIELQTMKERHILELKQLERKYQDDREKLIRDTKRETQRAAKTYQTVKNTFLNRMRRLDNDMSKQLRSIVTSLNICNDIDNKFFNGLQTGYKLICPLIEIDGEHKPRELSPQSPVETNRINVAISPISMIFENAKQVTTAMSKNGVTPNSPTAVGPPQFRVYKAVDLLEFKLVAIKLYPPLIQLSDDLVHETLIRVHEIIYGDYHTFVVMDLMEHNLSTFLKQTGQLSRGTIAKIIYTMLHALHYMSSVGVVHREVQPKNIYVTFEQKFKIFHVGVMKGIKGVELCVGEMFSAPELFGCTVGFASDMWSLGVVFAHLLQTPEERENIPLFAADDENAILSKMVQLTKPSEQDLEQFCTHIIENKEKVQIFEKLKHVQQAEPSISSIQSCISGANEDELDLLQKMLQFLPSKRITPSEALAHTFFTKNILNDYVL